MTTILLATDDVGAQVWKATATRLGLQVATVVRTAEAVQPALDNAADIVLLSGPGLGRPVAPLVRAVRAVTQDCSVLAVPSAEEDPQAVADAGADAVLHGLGDRAHRSAVLGQARTAARTRRTLARARLMAETAPSMDRTAGTTNLALARLMLDNMLARAARQEEAVSVLAVEADAVAPLVAAHGGSASKAIDDELRARIRECVREYDIVASVAGGGMVVVLYPCDAGMAARVAGRLRSLADERLMIVGGQRASLSCSIGTATHPAGAPRARVDDMLHRASEALVDAQLAGGACVVESMPPMVGVRAAEGSG
ncbi:MAG: diguanylate cyclase [Myxococcota bacterium]|nr:diguanylate cyclase [Myxococcota bacterium]MEC8422568.1 diguanylate cyclase [Myxococcota bacterium]